MGGAGKTELSLQYALTNQQAYPGGICWIEARKQNISSQIVSFARTRLNLIPPEELKDHEEKVQWCWQNWPEGKTLIIFNDVNSYVHIESYLPPAGASFCILLTTRLKFRNESERLELNLLQPEDAFLLLELLVGKERVQAETDVAQEICRWLGYLPLGLKLVGRYLSRKLDLTLTEMLARLNAERLEQRALKEPEIESGIIAQLGVAAAFELSWSELNPLAQEIGCLLCIFDVVPIAWSVVEQYFCKTDSEELEDARDEQLLRLHLLQRVSNRVYRLHELVREFFQAKLIENSECNLQKAITTRIAKITKQNTFKIIEILNEKLLDWQWSNDILQPPALEIGEFLLIAQQAWSEGVGPLSQLILDHRIDGEFPSIGVRFYPRYDKRASEFFTYLQIGWNYSDDISDSVVELPPEIDSIWEDTFQENDSKEDLVTTHSQINWGSQQPNSNPRVEENYENISKGDGISKSIESKLIDSGWTRFNLSLFGNQASWPWQQVIQSSVGSLAQYLHERRLPVYPGFLSFEAAWHAACALTRKDYLRYSNYFVFAPIAIEAIELKLAESIDARFSLMMQYCVNQLRVEIDFAKQYNATHLQQNGAFRDFKRHSNASPEILLAYTTYVFEGALTGYQQLVDRWFPNLVSNFRLGSYLPARLIGTVVPPDQENKVKVDYYWEPLPNGQRSCVDFKLDNQTSSEDSPRYQSVLGQQEILRPDHQMNRYHNVRTWHPFGKHWLGNNPITELTYQWLWEDLARLKWVKDSFSHASSYGHSYWR